MQVPKPERKRRKAEPVTKIRLQFEKECIVCGARTNLQRHHVFGGTGRRRKSERYGLVAWICREHHTGDTGVHHNPELDLAVKRFTQIRFEREYDRERFVREFGRNYL